MIDLRRKHGKAECPTLIRSTGNGQIADFNSGAGLFAAVAGLVGKKKGERRE